MKTAILLTGPRGAGKSTFADACVKRFPQVQLFSRDAVLIEFCGQPKMGLEAIPVVRDRLEGAISSSTDAPIIIDYWNSDEEGRKTLMEKLKFLGVVHFICWYFITEKETHIDWYYKKEHKDRKGTEDLYLDYDIFHLAAEEIDKEGFDVVHRINPVDISVIPACLMI